MDTNTCNPSSIFKFLSDVKQYPELHDKFLKEIETWNDPEFIREQLMNSKEFSPDNLGADTWDKIIRYETEALMIANLCNDELQEMIKDSMC